jgi:transcriptional regulator with XRE-family HTH domain
MDMFAYLLNHRGMAAAPPRRRSNRPAKPLYIGQWLAALRLNQRTIAKAAKVNEGYFSQLISGEKTNPSTPVLETIGRAMGIPWHYLFEPPPNKEFLQTAFSLDPAVLLRLMPPKSPYN